MNRKTTYRICLVMIIMAAIASGIYYYQFVQKKDSIPKEGTFVWQSLAESECV